MTTSIHTHNPARSDVPAKDAKAGRRAPSGWAVAGLGAGLAGVATIVTSSLVDTIYQPRYNGRVDGVAVALGEKVPVMYAFHTVTALGAVLMIVFAAGLYRRLHAGMRDSIAPAVAAAGLFGTAVVSILGSGLDTEIAGAVGAHPLVDDANAALYNHWIAAVPWLWTLAGLAGVALFAASRRGVVSRWMGIVGLVLGGLTVLVGVSPLEYLAGVTGALWLVVTAVGFLVGDRRYRTAA